MDPMNGQKSVIISINDILDELMSENKRLFNELLFANNCFNELKTHLINIHSKYQTIIDCEDIQRWDQLNDKTSGGKTSRDLAFKLSLKTKCWQLLTKSSDGSDVRLKSPSNSLKTQEVIQTIDDNIREDLQFWCQYKHCNQMFETKYELIRHSMIHKRQQLKSSLNRHQLRTQSLTHRKTLKCRHNDCPFETTNSSSFTSHLATTHSSDGPLICPLIGCKKSYKCKYQLTLHLKSHKTSHKFSQRFKCTISGCNDCFVTDYDRHLHQKTVHNNTNTEDTDVCNVNESQILEISDKSGIKSRDTIIATEPVFELVVKSRLERDKYYDLMTKSYKCPFNGCNRLYETNRLFYAHIRKAHCLPKYRCEYKGCGKTFKTSSNLRNHSPIHSGVKAYKCHLNDCHFETHHRKNLNKHFNSHSTDKPFVCHFTGCGKSFKTKSGLESHASTHTSVFKCNVCDQTFPSPIYLDTHRRTHSSDPTYKCGHDDCQQMFYTQTQRRKHLTDAHNMKPKNKPLYGCDWPGCDWIGGDISHHKRSHTGEKPYVCQWPDCDKRFSAKSRLNDHMNVHNNVKPYTCHWPGCHYTAANTSNVIKHRKQVHKT